MLYQPMYLTTIKSDCDGAASWIDQGLSQIKVSCFEMLVYKVVTFEGEMEPVCCTSKGQMG